MNAAVLRRFVILMAIALVGLMTFQWIYDYFTSREPGDYATEVGNNRLSEGKYDEALKNFNTALDERPDHRGALMGRALVFIQTERYDEALSELDRLIAYLTRTIKPDDATGRGQLAAAHANRGIIYDRLGQYEKALDEYVAALNTDEKAISGPDIFQEVLYSEGKTSTVRKRAQYIYEQLQLPESERLMRVPEIDAQQRMYKP